MPTVNLFYQDDMHRDTLAERADDIKTYIAAALSCGDITLDIAEVSMRFLHVEGNTMIGRLEVEVTAHAFGERIDKQDEICLNIRGYLNEIAW